VVEAALGLWLLYGRAKRLLWLTSLLFFSALAGISLYLALSGVPSCGCVGERISISPWYALLGDVVAAIALWSSRPSLAGLSWKPACLWIEEVRPAIVPLRMPLLHWLLSLTAIAAWG